MNIRRSLAPLLAIGLLELAAVAVITMMFVPILWRTIP